jgi:hypothetical protein
MHFQIETGKALDLRFMPDKTFHHHNPHHRLLDLVRHLALAISSARQSMGA